MPWTAARSHTEESTVWRYLVNRVSRLGKIAPVVLMAASNAWVRAASSYVPVPARAGGVGLAGHRPEQTGDQGGNGRLGHYEALLVGLIVFEVARQLPKFCRHSEDRSLWIVSEK